MARTYLPECVVFFVVSVIGHVMPINASDPLKIIDLIMFDRRLQI
jgi:hypothetical protein